MVNKIWQQRKRKKRERKEKKGMMKEEDAAVAANVSKILGIEDKRPEVSEDKMFVSHFSHAETESDFYWFSTPEQGLLDYLVRTDEDERVSYLYYIICS